MPLCFQDSDDQNNFDDKIALEAERCVDSRRWQQVVARSICYYYITYLLSTYHSRSIIIYLGLPTHLSHIKLPFLHLQFYQTILTFASFVLILDDKGQDLLCFILSQHIALDVNHTHYNTSLVPSYYFNLSLPHSISCHLVLSPSTINHQLGCIDIQS